MTDDARIHLRVRGRVQGVGFRRFVERAARANDLAGWVRNGDDGSVEIVAAGDAEGLAVFQADVRRGPAGAKVEGLGMSRPNIDETLDRPFTIRHC